jgi:thioredoxin reductase
MMYDLIIVGGGPAGLAAAMYAHGKQLDFLMIYDDIGGKAGTPQHLHGEAREEYLPGAEAVLLFERRITSLAGRTLRDHVVEVTKVNGEFHLRTEHHGVYASLAVLVATGATPTRLDAPGARELLGYGLGYSATTHAHLLEGKTAAVIGTTVRALRGAAELSRTAARIYLVAPDATGMTTPLAQALCKRPNVEPLVGYAVQQVVGASNVEELIVARDGDVRRLRVDAAFVDLGLSPNSMMVQRIVQTDLDGFIWVDDRNATMQPGLFAAGDVTTAFGEQVLLAIGEGARAALSAYDFLLARPPSSSR